MPPHHPIITRAEARAADARALSILGLPSAVLMENAGRQLATVTIAEATRYNCRTALVIAARGNNGGDGLVASRHLRLAGFPVQVVLVCGTSTVPPDSDFGRNLRAAAGSGVPVLHAFDAGSLEASTRSMGARTLIVDAVLGTGLEGPVRDPLRGVLRWMGDCGRPVVAVDLPSGLDADTGEELGPVPLCVATATFLAVKRGLTVGRGPATAGRITVCDIGVPPDCVLPRTRAPGVPPE
jgi:NAD(P)H-hydrate epimerase